MAEYDAANGIARYATASRPAQPVHGKVWTPLDEPCCCTVAVCEAFPAIPGRRKCGNEKKTTHKSRRPISRLFALANAQAHSHRHTLSEVLMCRSATDAAWIVQAVMRTRTYPDTLMWDFNKAIPGKTTTSCRFIRGDSPGGISLGPAAAAVKLPMCGARVRSMSGSGHRPIEKLIGRSLNCVLARRTSQPGPLKIFHARRKPSRGAHQAPPAPPAAVLRAGLLAAGPIPAREAVCLCHSQTNCRWGVRLRRWLLQRTAVLQPHGA